MTASAPVRTNGHRRRGAGFYLMVLSVSTILMITGLSALLAVRIQRRGSEGGNDLVAASLYAQSAIDLGMHWIENDPTWRTSRGEGFWAVKQLIGEGSFTLEANDLGNNKLLEDSADTDSVLLTGTGFNSDARYKLQVTLAPQLNSLSCLEVGLHVGTDVIFNVGTVQSDQTISANNSIDGTDATGNADLEAVVSVIPGGIVGTQTTGIAPRDMPDPATVFDYYTTNGTYIDIGTLGTSGGDPALQIKTLSPATNPYGAGLTNAEGIYVIDCAGLTIKIQNCRIVGTLVLLNPGVNSTVSSAVNWEPAIPNYPALLVQGNIALQFQSGSTLDEGTPLDFNFNPPGTPYPYPGGDEDKLLDDSYPTVIKGLVYVSGDLTTLNNPSFDGVVVVGNTATLEGNVNLTYQETYFDTPPPGFIKVSGLRIVAGSWKQVVD
ncbi:MAG: hypothetical protein IID34_01385 [Planctomycetes bacterium]|nr:hypothetical protein [Planctomycetota bacterium]